jgi:hypothetical protein
MFCGEKMKIDIVNNNGAKLWIDFPEEDFKMLCFGKNDKFHYQGKIRRVQDKKTVELLKNNISVHLELPEKIKCVERFV